jgi:hypothetical protein
MGRKNSKRQKLYRMKGCSKSRKNRSGGSPSNINLAYPSNNVPTAPNPFLAYTGKGGSPANLAYPSTGPSPNGFNFLNPQGSQHGGNCGCGLMNGGGRRRRGGMCPTCGLGHMVGGTHRVNCKCSVCKMKGGSGNNGIPYPNGLVGNSWTPAVGGWPGVDGVSGDRNHLALNTYLDDTQTSMIATGANPPFSVGGKKHARTKKQRGGVLSNFLSQDFINLGRQFQYGVGSAYNALAGYQGPVNPMPWRGQLSSTPNLSTVKAAYNY